MKIPVLPIFILLFFPFLGGAIFFINDAAGINSEEFGLSGFNQGRILGAYEAAARGSDSFNPSLYTFPEADMLVPAADPIPHKKDGVSDYVLPVGSGAVLDFATGAFLYGSNPDKVVPIASITKLVSALVFLDHNPGWETVYKLQADDIITGGRIYLGVGEEVSIKDLFYLSLIGSDNTATRALARAAGLTLNEFVAAMNAKAISLGLRGTAFVDPIGLGDENVSTAREVAKLIRAAMAIEEISLAESNTEHTFKTAAGREVTVYSTNSLLYKNDGDIKSEGGKTGFIDLAGYCYAGKFRNETGRRLVAVALGADDREARFRYARDLAAWAYDSYVWDGR